VSKRNKLRKSLNRADREAFFFRILADEALQEHEISSFPKAYPPFADVNFDFRSCNTHKWDSAIGCLLLESGDALGRTPLEEEMLSRSVDPTSYADPTEFCRIQTIDRNIKLLRAVYDASWNPESVGDDQRCVFAVISDELYSHELHEPWLNRFKDCLEEREIRITQGRDY